MAYSCKVKADTVDTNDHTMVDGRIIFVKFRKGSIQWPIYQDFVSNEQLVPKEDFKKNVLWKENGKRKRKKKVWWAELCDTIFKGAHTINIPSKFGSSRADKMIIMWISHMVLC